MNARRSPALVTLVLGSAWATAPSHARDDQEGRAAEETPAGEYFLPADVAGPLDLLPLRVQLRLDLTYVHFEDSDNLDEFDGDDLLPLNPALRLEYELDESFRLVSELEYEGHDHSFDLDELFLRAESEALHSRVDLGVNVIPFGIERFFDSPVTNPFVDRPSPFRQIIPGTYSDWGIFLQTELEEEAGRGLEAELALTRALKREGRPSNDDFPDSSDSLQVSGRLGAELLPGARIGVSGLVTHPESGEFRGARLFGVDVAWQRELYYVRAEYVGGIFERSQQRGPDLHRRGWYAEVYRRIPFDQPWLVALEAALRVDSLDDDTRKRNSHDVTRYAVGLNWVIREGLRLKTEYLISDERGDEIGNNGLFVQLSWTY